MGLGTLRKTVQFICKLLQFVFISIYTAAKLLWNRGCNINVCFEDILTFVSPNTSKIKPTLFVNGPQKNQKHCNVIPPAVKAHELL